MGILVIRALLFWLLFAFKAFLSKRSEVSSLQYSISTP